MEKMNYNDRVMQVAEEMAAKHVLAWHQLSIGRKAIQISEKMDDARIAVVKMAEAFTEAYRPHVGMLTLDAALVEYGLIPDKPE